MLGASSVLLYLWAGCVEPSVPVGFLSNDSMASGPDIAGRGAACHRVAVLGTTHVFVGALCFHMFLFQAFQKLRCMIQRIRAQQSPGPSTVLLTLQQLRGLSSKHREFPYAHTYICACVP